MKGKTIGLVLMTTVLLAGGALWLSGCKGGDQAGHAGAIQKANYHCPMHPTYTSDKPGDCPICGMRLVPIQSPDQHERAVQETGPTGQPLFYRHPMRSEVTSPVPKKDEMGMDYVPVYQEEKNGTSASVPGQAPIQLNAEREQLIGVRSGPVEKRNLVFLVRASGRVAYDPDLYNAITEYKEAVRAKGKTQDSPWPDVLERSSSLVRAAQLRLRQMGISESQMERLMEATDDPTNLLLGRKGGSVWVYAQIYEYESGLVKPGQIMEVTSSSLAGRRLKGRVVAVDSILSAESRTLKVRAEIANLQGLLKPEMYVDATILVDLGRRLAVPEEAILDTGTRQLVFVEKRPGFYEPKEVELGHEAEDYREVLSGVEEGERVVTSANFLVDSESKLKAAISQAGSGHQHGK